MNILKILILGMVCMTGTASAGTIDQVYTIDDAYRAALGGNEIIRIAQERVIQSESRVNQAWTYLYPRLVAQGAYTRFNETLPPEGGAFLFQPLEQYQAALILTQPLYTGGRTRAALRTAQKLRESSIDGLSMARQDMMMNVAEAYYGVLKAQRAVDISAQSLERMEHHKETAEREAATRKSKANRSVLLRANSLVSQASIGLVRARDGLKIAREKLSLLTKLSRDIRLEEPKKLNAPSEDLGGLQRIALENRDDYSAVGINKSIAEENVTIVRGGHYPQLSALAGAQYQESQPAIFTDATTYYAGLRLTVPIFEGGLMRAEVSEAKSMVRQAELSREFLRTSIEADVQEAYVNLQTVLSVLETARLEMDYAKNNYDAVESLFAEGLLGSLSLIDAEQALTMAERELMSATYDRELAILRLTKSIGLLGKES